MGRPSGRNPDVDRYVAQLQPHLGQIVEALRDLIFEVEQSVEETMKSGHPSYSLNGHLCDIIAMEKHVILGFLKGVGLTDPSGLLHGTGKRYREAEFKRLEDVKREELRALIKEAVQLNVRGKQW
jgi:hypothetical protein